MNSAQSSVTIDELAAMVAEGFSTMDTRFDGIDLRLDHIEVRLTTVEAKTDTLHTDLRSLAYDQRRLKTRVEHVEESEFGSIQEP